MFFIKTNKIQYFVRKRSNHEFLGVFDAPSQAVLYDKVDAHIPWQSNPEDFEYLSSKDADSWEKVENPFFIRQPPK